MPSPSTGTGATGTHGGQSCRHVLKLLAALPLGGGCASLLAVLTNDKADPLGFGPERKRVDELYGFVSVINTAASLQPTWHFI